MGHIQPESSSPPHARACALLPGRNLSLSLSLSRERGRERERFMWIPAIDHACTAGKYKETEGSSMCSRQQCLPGKHSRALAETDMVASPCQMRFVLYTKVRCVLWEHCGDAFSLNPMQCMHPQALAPGGVSHQARASPESPPPTRVKVSN